VTALVLALALALALDALALALALALHSVALLTSLPATQANLTSRRMQTWKWFPAKVLCGWGAKSAWLVPFVDAHVGGS